MIRLRTLETPFKSKLNTKDNTAYLTNGHDEVDRGIVDSGHESMNSTSTTVDDEVVEKPATVKVVGELLKKDVQSVPRTDSVPFIEPMLNEIDLSSLIIAKDLVIGGSPFVKSDPKSLKKKPTTTATTPVPEAARKKRVQRAAEDSKQKAVGTPSSAKANASPAQAVEKSRPKEAKPSSLVRQAPVTRCSSKDSINGGIVNGTDKTKKKLSPKLSLDSRAKDVKKDSGGVKVQTKKPKSGLPSPGLKSRTPSTCNGKAGPSAESTKETYKKFYECALNRKHSAQWAENSFYKDLDEMFADHVVDSGACGPKMNGIGVDQVNECLYSHFTSRTSV